MKEKINVIQFLPYFPPHKGGVETVGEEIGKYWCKNNFGEFVNLVTDFEQDLFLSYERFEKIIFKNEIIGYKKDNYEVLVFPSLEIINNFPVYKFWTKKYRLINLYLHEKIGNNKNNFRIFTHTRFFLTSFIGGIFARKNKIKWIHIEHGSDYVKLSSKFKSYISIIYDKIFGKWIFKKSDILLAISEACKNFVNKEFVTREVEVFYRGLELTNNIEIVENLNNKFHGKIIIGYVGRLYKWKNVESLIKAYYLLNKNIKNEVKLVIVGDGEDFDRLKNIDKEDKVYFTGGKSFVEALSYQKQFDVHIHPSSPGGGLATTLLQAMSFGCFIVASPNEGAKEVIIDNENGFLLKNDSVEVIKSGIEKAINNLSKRKDFAFKNKEIIEKKFNWENNILELYNLIK